MDNKNKIYDNPLHSQTPSKADCENFSKYEVKEEAIKCDLNYRLALSKGISVGAIKSLKVLHDHLSNVIFPYAKKLSPKFHSEELRKIGIFVRDIEFKMQELWGFPKSSSFHTHYCRIPHCKCNEANINPYRLPQWGKEEVREINCPVHGVVKN